MINHPPDHVLADYAAGRLSHEKALHLHAHVTICARCQQRQSHLHDVEETIRTTLYAVTPRPAQLERWWSTIRDRRTYLIAPTRAAVLPMLAPLLVAITLLLAPLAAGWTTGADLRHALHTTAASPVLNTTLLPAQTSTSNHEIHPGMSLSASFTPGAALATPDHSPGAVPALTPIPTP